jgi:hypothetical protein
VRERFDVVSRPFLFDRNPASGPHKAALQKFVKGLDDTELDELASSYTPGSARSPIESVRWGAIRREQIVRENRVSRQEQRAANVEKRAAKEAAGAWEVDNLGPLNKRFNDLIAQTRDLGMVDSERVGWIKDFRLAYGRAKRA